MISSWNSISCLGFGRRSAASFGLPAVEEGGSDDQDHPKVKGAERKVTVSESSVNLGSVKCPVCSRMNTVCVYPVG